MTLRAFSLTVALALLPLAASADQIRLLAIGDSLTAGYGLAPSDGLAAQLQDWLQDRGHDALVVNAGVSGDTTQGGKERIATELGRHDADAVIVELGGNDLLAGLPPGVVERNLDEILTQIGRAGLPALLVGIGRPDGNAALRRSWADIWPRLGERHGALVHDNLYGPFFALSDRELRAALQQDHVHASKSGVGMIVEALGPKVEALIAEVEMRRMAVGG